MSVLAVAAALGCGLIGGVFFAFSAFVMKALAKLPAAHGIAAMQSINVVVLNFWFLGAFFGTALLCAIALTRRSPRSRRTTRAAPRPGPATSPAGPPGTTCGP